MSQVIRAHFDGKVLVPDEHVNLPVGQPLRLHVELAESQGAKFADLLGFAADVPGAPADLAAQHDHYLYGTPKK